MLLIITQHPLLTTWVENLSVKPVGCSSVNWVDLWTLFAKTGNLLAVDHLFGSCRRWESISSRSSLCSRAFSYIKALSVYYYLRSESISSSNFKLQRLERILLHMLESIFKFWVHIIAYAMKHLHQSFEDILLLMLKGNQTSKCEDLFKGSWAYFTT